MGLSAGISIWIPEETAVDVKELAEDAKTWLFGRFDGCTASRPRTGMRRTAR